MVHSAGKDIISDMPMSIVELILEALPLCDAVKTSILSRKWRYRWATISKLVFDSQFFTSLSKKYLSDLQLKSIINKLLLLHTGSIVKFTIHIHDGIKSLTEDLNQWLRFLPTKGIKELSLHYPSGHVYFFLGTKLYSCVQLTHLSLRNCVLSPPNTFEGFPNLTTIELLSVLSLDSEYNTLISKCPRLESISIDGCLGVVNLMVPAPNLTYLQVKGLHSLKTICLKSTIYVATLSISLRSIVDDVQKCKMEKLCFGDDVLKVANCMPKRLPTTLDNLKKIALFDVNFKDPADISLTLCLLRSSPNLSQLEITGVRHLKSDIFQDQNHMAGDHDHDHDCSFSQLRIVKFKRMSVLKTEMALVKLLLAHSPLLEKMYVQLGNGIGTEASLATFKELMQFTRASPKAAVVYVDP